MRFIMISIQAFGQWSPAPVLINLTHWSQSPWRFPVHTPEQIFVQLLKWMASKWQHLSGIWASWMATWPGKQLPHFNCTAFCCSFYFINSDASFHLTLNNLSVHAFHIENIGYRRPVLIRRQLGRCIPPAFVWKGHYLKWIIGML